MSSDWDYSSSWTYHVCNGSTLLFPAAIAAAAGVSFCSSSTSASSQAHTSVSSPPDTKRLPLSEKRRQLTACDNAGDKQVVTHSHKKRWVNYIRNHHQDVADRPGCKHAGVCDSECVSGCECKAG